MRVASMFAEPAIRGALLWVVCSANPATLDAQSSTAWPSHYGAAIDTGVGMAAGFGPAFALPGGTGTDVHHSVVPAVTVMYEAVGPVRVGGEISRVRGVQVRGAESNLRGRLLGPTGRSSSIQEAPGLRGNTMIGLATGITVASVAVPLSLGASTCFGSGDYLQTCRLIFVGAAAVGGGLGALVGRAVKSEDPPGRATAIMVGSALGAVGTFLASLPFCGQEEAENPDLLCGYDGMIEPSTVVGGAVVGGILGFLLRGGSESLMVSQLGPVRTPDGRNALALAVAISR